MIKIDIRITLSKILAFLIVILSAILSWKMKDEKIIMAALPVAGTVMAIKTYTEGK